MPPAFKIHAGGDSAPERVDQVSTVKFYKATQPLELFFFFKQVFPTAIWRCPEQEERRGRASLWADPLTKADLVLRNPKPSATECMGCLPVCQNFSSKSGMAGITYRFAAPLDLLSACSELTASRNCRFLAGWARGRQDFVFRAQKCILYSPGSESGGARSQEPGKGVGRLLGCIFCLSFWECPV